MMRRLGENVIVAVVASAVTWALSHPGESAEVMDASVIYLLDRIAALDGPFGDLLWTVARVMVILGIALQVRSMAPPTSSSTWEYSVSFPSASTTLMAVGAALWLTAGAVEVADSQSVWALPMLASVVFWASRWAAGIGRRWRSMAEAL
jgi:hypothetical protein